MKSKILIIFLLLLFLIGCDNTNLSGQAFKMNNKLYEPESLIIVFNDDVDLSFLPDTTKEINEINKIRGFIKQFSEDYKIKSIRRIAKKSDKFPYMNNAVVIKIKNPDKMISKIKDNPNVKYVDFDYYVQNLVNDPLYDCMYNLKNDIIEEYPGIKFPGLNKNPTYDADIDFDLALQYNGFMDVVIAVLDSGVDYNHPELQGQIWINYAEYYGQENVDDDNNGYIDDIHGYDFVKDSDLLDPNGHGTHVAGIIAAKSNNNIGIAGICQQCKIMSLKTLDSNGNGLISVAIEAFVYAIENGADIIQNSWGFNQPIHLPILENIISYAYYEGLIVVFSAGNRNYCLSGCENSVYITPVSMYPGNELLVVASTDYNDKRSVWYENIDSASNYGTTIDLSAPGTNIISLRSEGSCAYCSYPDILDDTCNSGNVGEYRIMSGTSMAAPHVSAIAGWLWSLNPSWTNEQIMNKLKQSTDDIYFINPEFTGLLGTGRINQYYTYYSMPDNEKKTAIHNPIYSLNSFNVDVTNYGNYPEHNYIVYFHSNSDITQSYTIPLIQPQETKTITFNWVEKPGKNNIKIYSTRMFNELYGADNYLEKEIVFYDGFINKNDENLR